MAMFVRVANQFLPMFKKKIHIWFEKMELLQNIVVLYRYFLA